MQNANRMTYGELERHVELRELTSVNPHFEVYSKHQPNTKEILKAY